MAQCAVCGKKTSFGNKLSITRSHVSKRSVKAVRPNLRTVMAVVDGENKKITVCARCLRTPGKVKRAV